jgi:hypothetical protein
MEGCSACAADTATSECTTCKPGYYGPDDDKKC